MYNEKQHHFQNEKHRQDNKRLEDKQSVNDSKTFFGLQPTQGPCSVYSLHW